MKSYSFKNGSGLALRVIEDEIQNHFDNDIIIFGKNKKVLEQVEQLTNTTPSIVAYSPLTMMHYQSDTNNFFSCTYHYSQRNKSKDFLNYKLINRYYTNIMSALETTFNPILIKMCEDSPNSPFDKMNQYTPSIAIMPLSWRDKEANALTLITSIWLISISIINRYYPFGSYYIPTPKEITIVCNEGVNTILDEIRYGDYADTNHISNHIDPIFNPYRKRIKNEYLWKLC